MDKEQIIQLAKSVVDDEFITIYDVDHVNHTPHPYMIGTDHIVHASDNHSGMLGEETMKAIQCAHPKCQLSYEEHTSDHVMFLQFKKDITNIYCNDQLKLLADALKDEIDGFALVEGGGKVIE